MAFLFYILLPHLHNANVCKIDVESFSLAKPLTLLIRLRKSFLNTNFTNNFKVYSNKTCDYADIPEGIFCLVILG